jgi:hemerythrin-like domain-containing protein
MVEFLEVFVDRHHHGKEESYLFPILERKGILKEDGPLAAIEREHQIERDLTRAMRAAVAAYSDSNEEAKRCLAETSRSYVGHMTAHIRAEDSLLFRLADELMDEADLASLRNGFESALLELSPHTVAEYEELATRLEDAWII